MRRGFEDISGIEIRGVNKEIGIGGHVICISQRKLSFWILMAFFTKQNNNP